MTHKAEIAGAGFAGLTAATALAQQGWRVRIHETTSAVRSFGAGIFLWENGLRVLKRLGVLDEVLVDSYTAPAWEERTADGRLLGRMPLPLPSGARMVTMTRQHLHDQLLGAARASGVEIVTDSTVLGATPKGVLYLRDGEVEADVVIGADGVRSQVRDSLGLLEKHEHFAVGVFRFLVDPTHVPSDGFWRCYLNLWDTVAARRALVVPCDSEHLYLLLSAKREDHEALAQPLDAELWSRAYPALREALHSLEGSPRFDYYERVRCTRWTTGRVAIVGDAAHAMPPTLGQGAGTAMANALSLADALAGSQDPVSALAHWERTSRPETERTQTVSVERIATLFPDPTVTETEEWGEEILRFADR